MMATAYLVLHFHVADVRQRSIRNREVKQQPRLHYVTIMSEFPGTTTSPGTEVRVALETAQASTFREARNRVIAQARVSNPWILPWLMNEDPI